MSFSWLIPIIFVLILIFIALQIGNKIWDTFNELRAKAQARKAAKQKEKQRE